MSARQAVIPDRSPWPVILVGRDHSLLRVRQAAMERRGVGVHSMSPEQAEFPAHDGKPRLWVLCGSIEEAALVFLACTIRRYSPGSRLFLVEWVRPAGAERCLFHRVLDREADEDALAEAIRNGWKAPTTEMGD
ncbi:MAG: hypothetical protein WBW84_03805 [Acidobacteriaceae bacterium]